MQEVAGKICKNYLHGAWKVVDPKDLDCHRISGGLSNFLYYVALPDNLKKYRSKLGNDVRPALAGEYSEMNMDEPKKVLLRIYGQVHGERAMDAIVTESVIFTLLSERRLGPKLHGVFSGGRIEEYIPARPLLVRELGEPQYSMKIAEKTAAIHSMDVPLSKEPNWIWKTMGKWLKTVKEELASGTHKGKTPGEANAIKRLRSIDFEKEVEWLKKFLATVDSPVVFCHNDLQEGNILLPEDPPATTDEFDTFAQPLEEHAEDSAPRSDKENNHTPLQAIAELPNDGILGETSRHLMRTSTTQPAIPSFIDAEDANTSDSIHSHISDSGEPRLVLIDFEYCAYNYRGFDIANHFSEWCYDYTNPEYPYYYEIENAPTLEQKEIFIKEYLKHYHANSSEDKEMSPPSIDAVNKLLAEVEAFALASHLFWALWSVINAGKSEIQFGYWEYGLARAETYLRLKQEMMKKEKYGFPQKRKICEVDI